MGSEAQAVQLEVRINRQGKNLTVGAVYDRPRPSGLRHCPVLNEKRAVIDRPYRDSLLIAPGAAR